jgi:hypothetical protein
MYCSAELWRGGTEVWRIEHDSQQGMLHIQASGALPDGYSAIENEFAGKQRDAGGERSDTDYIFEIPLQVARSIVGFKHDEPGGEARGFKVFECEICTSATDKTTKSRWKFW